MRMRLGLLRWRAWGARWATLPAAVFLIACAPDAWRPDDRYETFLDQVQQRCGYERIGSRAIGSDLLQDAYFLDVTSRFYHRQIGPENYANAVSGSFGGATDSEGIRCILNQFSLSRIHR